MKRNQLGLNLLNFLTAAVQAGFGPFIAVWLTQGGWSLAALGVALSIGTFAALLSQLPGGLLVDQIHRKHIPAAVALIALGGSALMLYLPPTRPLVWGAEVAHACASSVMIPAIAALTLVTCGHGGYGERLGVNTRYASLGNAAAAALLGLAATIVSEQAVFLVTAALAIPALGSLLLIRQADHVDPQADHPALRHPREREHRPWHIFAQPALHVFAAAIVLFQVANAALLPVALNGLTERHEAPGYVISATIVVPQMITALIGPWAGRLAQRIGRRPVLLAGFVAVPLRALLFAAVQALLPASTSSPLLPAMTTVAIQALDGVDAAIVGLMLPLIAADLTRRTGHLNLAIGTLGLAAQAGGTISTAVAGWVGGRYGDMVCFAFLAGAGLLGTLLLAFAMPETRLAHPSGGTAPAAQPA